MATKGNVGRGGGHSPANVTKHLKGIDFPANKQDLLKHAKSGGADNQVLEEIQAMDEREFGSMADVMKSYGKGQGTQSSKSSSKSTSKSSSAKSPSSKSSTSRSSSSSKRA